MKRIAGALALVATALFISSQNPTAQSVGAIVWQTTFNCPEWNQSAGILDAAVCLAGDNIRGHGLWTTPGHPNGDEITLAANNAGGGGGRGFRHWRADGFDVNGGGLKISLPANYADVWLRMYMRYQAGFNWNPAGSPVFTKDMYMIGNSGIDWTFGFHGSNSMWGWTNSGSIDSGTIGWTTIMRGNTGDGQWHCYEYHIKRGTTTSNGVKQYWVDGVQGMNVQNANTGISGGWTEFILGSNQDKPANGGDMYTDYDDLAFSSSGRVGCSGSSTVPPPAAPLNPHIIR